MANPGFPPNPTFAPNPAFAPHPAFAPNMTFAPNPAFAPGAPLPFSLVPVPPMPPPNSYPRQTIPSRRDERMRVPNPTKRKLKVSDEVSFLT